MLAILSPEAINLKNLRLTLIKDLGNIGLLLHLNALKCFYMTEDFLFLYNGSHRVRYMNLVSK